jgi:hypothetical protein
MELVAVALDSQPKVFGALDDHINAIRARLYLRNDTIPARGEFLKNLLLEAGFA